MSDSRATHYTLRHRITAAISQGMFRNFEYTVRHGLLKGMRRRGGLGWLPEWFPGAGTRTAEQAFWEELDLRGKVVWDVGAFEGLLTLHFARSAAQVVAWEPNPETRARLERNLTLNGVANVMVRPFGVSNVAGTVHLVNDPLMPGGASADPSISAQTRDTTAAATETTIPVVTLDQDLTEQSLPVPDLIKLDIEGMELQALDGAVNLLRRHSPALFIEMHGADAADKLAKAENILVSLRSSGYSAILHVESGTRLPAGPTSAQVASRGHLYCTV